MKSLETIEQKEIIKRDDLYNLYQEFKKCFYNIPTFFLSVDKPEKLLEFIEEIENENKKAEENKEEKKYEEKYILKLREYYGKICLYKEQGNKKIITETEELSGDTKKAVDSSKGIIGRILEKIGLGKKDNLVKNTIS